jgi:hypothetical protein
MPINLNSILGIQETNPENTESKQIISESETNKDNLITEVTGTQPAITADFEAIVEEWSWRCSKGFPTIVDGKFAVREEVEILNQILIENKLNPIPLPEATPKKKPAVTKPTAAVGQAPKSTTGLKEGLVMYFACQSEADINTALDKLKNKTSAKLKFKTDIIKKELYDGNEEPAAENVKNAINYLNNNVIDDKNLRETYVNGLTSGLYLIKNLGKLNPELIDRGSKAFGEIKKHAVTLLQGMNVSLGTGESDKWCPADIFIYGDPSAISTALKATMINAEVQNKKNPALNGLFVDEFEAPRAGKIIGISLKEATARAGKATSFQKLLSGGTDYKVDKDVAQDIATKLLASLTGITREKGRNIEPEYKLGNAAEALGYIKNYDKELKSLGSVPQLETVTKSLNLLMKTTFGEDVKNANTKEKAKGLFKISNKYTYPDSDSKIIKTVNTAISVYKSSLIKYAEATYTKSRKAFLDTLKKSKFDQPGQPPVAFKDTDELDVVANIFLKKAGCYDVASKLLDGYQVKAKLSLPEAFKTIITKEKNVFLALTAYAISQGGISPTFFKLIGSNSPTSSAHHKEFPSDGVVTLVEGGKVKIVDSPGSAGFAVTFICQIKENNKLVDKYQVELAFAYAGGQFKIEVNELLDI